MSKKKKEQESYGQVPLKTLKRAIQQIENNAKVYNMTKEQVEEIPVTFEYLIGSFFPEVVKNVHEEANKQYTKGYFDGRKSMEEELKNGSAGSNS